MKIKSLKGLLWLGLFLVMALAAVAQKTHSLNAAEIQLGLRKLNTLGTVLYFAAHPDDENTRLITWLAKEKQYRTGYLSLTRGDGGQNLIGTEQGEELGLIRTQELLVARQLDGGEQFFSRANDFGFSKTSDETFRIWGREKILADAVWTIRMFRPDVIITRFPPDERGGHGHHQASAILAEEAFHAAADPDRFPEQLAFVQPWQVKRLVWNTFSFGSANTIREGQFNIRTGQYNALLGRSYGEIAAESRSSHRTQGFGAAWQRGQTSEYFEIVKGDRPRESLFDGIETSWKRVKGAEAVPQLIDKLITSFEPAHPERSVEQLISVLSIIEQLEDHFWRTIKSAEIRELIVACAGLWLESYASAPAYAVGESINVSTQIIVRNPGLQVLVDSIYTGAGHQISPNLRLKRDTLSEVSTVLRADKVTQPYWLDTAPELGAYVVRDQRLTGLPENPDRPQTRILLSINGKRMWLERPIVYKSVHPAKGEIYEPLSITPVLTVNIPRKALVFNGRDAKKVEIRVTAHQPSVQTEIKPVLPAGWRAEPSVIPLRFKDRNEETVCQFTLHPPEKTTLLDSVSFSYRVDGRTETARAISRIQYDHVPAITWFPESKARLTKVETGVFSGRIGYLPGAGDLVAPSLRELGIRVDILDEGQVMKDDLSVYDAIITGVRLYNVSERMKVWQPRLLHYVEQGGTLLVQYNVNSRLNVPHIGPYPFSITRSRVTEEDAEVRFSEPHHPVLNVPNKITPADFEGWVQERGLYFVESGGDHYQTPLEMNDSGERPHRGSLLVASYGKGKFVYTSLSFFRQLPAGIPGAYRLFLNLLAKRESNNN